MTCKKITMKTHDLQKNYNENTWLAKKLKWKHMTCKKIKMKTHDLQKITIQVMTFRPTAIMEWFAAVAFSSKFFNSNVH
jgi:hypothetical protein